MPDHRKPVNPLLSKRAAKLLEDYLGDLALRARTRRTIENYRSNLRVFFEFIAPVAPDEAGQDELRRFLAHLRGERDGGGISAKAISRYFSALASFYEYLTVEHRIKEDPIPVFRRRYLELVQREARKNVTELRQLITLEDLRRLVFSIADIRDRAVLVLLAKTGARREELVNIDVEDIDWKEQSIQLKETRKRSQLKVLFDDETARLLQGWVRVRRTRGAPATGPLFTNQRGNRLDRNGVYDVITEAAQAVGLHDPKGNLKQKFTPHCLRHWFSDSLIEAGMHERWVERLRGDKLKRAIDVYKHTDWDRLRTAYREKIPQLGL